MRQNFHFFKNFLGCTYVPLLKKSASGESWYWSHCIVSTYSTCFCGGQYVSVSVSVSGGERKSGREGGSVSVSDSVSDGVCGGGSVSGGSDSGCINVSISVSDSDSGKNRSGCNNGVF